MRSCAVRCAAPSSALVVTVAVMAAPMLLAHALVVATRVRVERRVGVLLRERARRDATMLLQCLLQHCNVASSSLSHDSNKSKKDDSSDDDDDDAACRATAVVGDVVMVHVYVTMPPPAATAATTVTTRVCVPLHALEQHGYDVARVFDVYGTLRNVVQHTTRLRTQHDDDDEALLTNVWNCACAMVNAVLRASLPCNASQAADDTTTTTTTTATRSHAATARAAAQLLRSRRYRLPFARHGGGDGVRVQRVHARLLRRVDARTRGRCALRWRALRLYLHTLLLSHHPSYATTTSSPYDDDDGSTTTARRRRALPVWWSWSLLAQLALLAAPTALSLLLHAYGTPQTCVVSCPDAVVTWSDELQCVSRVLRTPSAQTITTETDANTQASSPPLLLTRVCDAVAHVSASALLFATCAALLDTWRDTQLATFALRSSAALTTDTFLHLARQDVIDSADAATRTTTTTTAAAAHTQPRYALAALATVAAASRFDDADAYAWAWLLRPLRTLRAWRRGAWACLVGACARHSHDALERHWQRVVDWRAYLVATRTNTTTTRTQRRHGSSDDETSTMTMTPRHAHYGVCVLLGVTAMRSRSLRRLAAHTRWPAAATTTAASAALLRHGRDVCRAAAAAAAAQPCERALRAYFVRAADDLHMLLPPRQATATRQLHARRRRRRRRLCHCRCALDELRAVGREAAYARGCSAGDGDDDDNAVTRARPRGDAWLLGDAVAHALRAARVAPLLCATAVYAQHRGCDDDDGHETVWRMRADVAQLDAAAEHTREVVARAARWCRRGGSCGDADVGGDAAAVDAAVASATAMAMLLGRRCGAASPHCDELTRARAVYAAAFGDDGDCDVGDAAPWSLLALRSRARGYVDGMALLQRLRATTPRLDGVPWHACASLRNNNNNNTNNDNGDDATAMAPWCVEFVHVWFRYPGATRWALRDVSFRVAPGRWLALLGDSGAGKTTVLRLLARLCAPTRGAVYVNGRDVADYAPRQLRRGIAAVWQLPSPRGRFFDGVDVAANVALGSLLDADDDAVARALRVARVPARLRAAAHTTPLRVDELSGGELERVALARCAVKSPARSGVVVLDECASALDAATEVAVLDALAACDDDDGDEKQRRRRRRTRVTTSHRLSSARGADVVAVLHDGALVERGRWDELVRDAARFVHFHALYAATTATATRAAAAA